MGAIATACISAPSDLEGEMAVEDPDNLTAWPVLVFDKMAELHEPVLPDADE